jgi:hypothetical protein
MALVARRNTLKILRLNPPAVQKYARPPFVVVAENVLSTRWDRTKSVEDLATDILSGYLHYICPFERSHRQAPNGYLDEDDLSAFKYEKEVDDLFHTIFQAYKAGTDKYYDTLKAINEDFYKLVCKYDEESEKARRFLLKLAHIEGANKDADAWLEQQLLVQGHEEKVCKTTKELSHHDLRSYHTPHTQDIIKRSIESDKYAKALAEQEERLQEEKKEFKLRQELREKQEDKLRQELREKEYWRREAEIAAAAVVNQTSEEVQVGTILTNEGLPTPSTLQPQEKKAAKPVLTTGFTVQKCITTHEPRTHAAALISDSGKRHAEAGLNKGGSAGFPKRQKSAPPPKASTGDSGSPPSTKESANVSPPTSQEDDEIVCLKKQVAELKKEKKILKELLQGVPRPPKEISGSSRSVGQTIAFNTQLRSPNLSSK